VLHCDQFVTRRNSVESSHQQQPLLPPVRSGVGESITMVVRRKLYPYRMDSSAAGRPNTPRHRRADLLRWICFLTFLATSLERDLVNNWPVSQNAGFLAASRWSQSMRHHLPAAATGWHRALDNAAASAAAVAEIESFYLLNDHLPAKRAVPFQNGRPLESGGNFKNWKIAAHLRSLPTR
jgi:hypothetical protein